MPMNLKLKPVLTIKRKNYSPIVTDGLVAAWDMEETSGIRRDEIGGQDIQELWNYTVPSADGLSGKALDQTGGSSYRGGAILTSASPIGRTSWSFSFCMKLTAHTGCYEIGTPAQLMLNPSGSTGALYSFSGSHNLGTTLTENVWYHIVETYDISTTKLAIYVNTVDKTSGGFVETTFTADSILYLGGADYAPLCYYDMLRLYNKVLSQAEINLLYNNGLGTPYRVSALPAYQETFKDPVVVASDGVQAAIHALVAPAVYNVPDGIHGITGTLNIPAGVTVQAAAGTRPMLVGVGGFAPFVIVGAGATLDGVWIGGAPSVGSTTGGFTPAQQAVQVGGAGVTIKNCTFWGFVECIEHGTAYATPALIDGNRIINTGHDTLSHSMYITAQPVGAGDTVQNNIMVGALGGWQFHFFHGPTNMTVQKNFLEGAACGTFEITGTGHTYTKNIVWNHRWNRGGLIYDIAVGATQTLSYSLVYGSTGYWVGSETKPPVNVNNYFCRAFTTMGTYKTIWTESQMETILSITATTINSAIDNIRRAFFETPATIYANTSIEGWFTTLSDLIATWDTWTDLAIPIIPSGLTATAISGTRIDLAWDDNSNNETGFEIYRSLTDSNYVLLDDVAADEESYSDTTCEADTRYYYKILATGTGGDSALTSSANAMYVVAAPSGLVVGVASGTQLDLTWVDNSSNETGFEIYRSETDSDYELLDDVAAGEESFSDTTCEALHTYYYKVRATGSGTNSAFSNSANATTVYFPDTFATLSNWTATVGTASAVSNKMQGTTRANVGNNLIINTEFATDTTDWQATATTLTRVDSSSDPGDDSSGHAAADKYVGKMVRGAASAEYYVRNINWSQISGSYYSFSILAYIPSATAVGLLLKAYLNGGYTSGQTSTKDAWTLVTLAGVGNNTVWNKVQFGDGSSEGEIIYVDKFCQYRQGTIMLLAAGRWESADGTITVAMPQPASPSVVPLGILFRYTDTLNYWECRMKPNTSGTDTQVIEVVAGVETVRASADVDWSTGGQTDQVKIVLDGTVVTVTKNRNGEGWGAACNYDTMATGEASTQLGIMLYDISLGRISSFDVE